MARIPLKIQGITDITAMKDNSLIVMTDVNGQRQLSIVCDRYMRHEFASRYRMKMQTENADKATADNSAKNNLKTALPETLGTLIKDIAGLQLEVVIVNVFDGQYVAVIEDKTSGLSLPIDVTAGALMCYANDMPLCIEESLWAKQSVPYLGRKAQGVALPLNTLTLDMLKQALDKCIKEERYELAKQLKEEIDRRDK